MRHGSWKIFVVVPALLALPLAAGSSPAQCPAPGGFVSPGAYGVPGSYASYGTAPFVVDSQSAWGGGYVSSPFGGPVSGMRCRVICYPATPSAAAYSSGGPYAYGPGFSQYPGTFPVGSYGTPYGWPGGTNWQFSCGNYGR